MLIEGNFGKRKEKFEFGGSFGTEILRCMNGYIETEARRF